MQDWACTDNNASPLSATISCVQSPPLLTRPLADLFRGCEAVNTKRPRGTDFFGRNRKAIALARVGRGRAGKPNEFERTGSVEGQAFVSPAFHCASWD
jgi:hypothetical protein